MQSLHQRSPRGACAAGRGVWALSPRNWRWSNAPPQCWGAPCSCLSLTPGSPSAIRTAGGLHCWGKCRGTPCHGGQRVHHPPETPGGLSLHESGTAWPFHRSHHPSPYGASKPPVSAPPISAAFTRHPPWGRAGLGQAIVPLAQLGWEAQRI